MNRDLAVSRADVDGYISYEILPTFDNSNLYELFAHRFLKLLLSDEYGGLLNTARNKGSQGSVLACVGKTDRDVKRLAAQYPDSMYTVYSGYRIKKLDINAATSSLLLEIDIVFKGGSTMTLSI